ncbi:hypothetical protein OG874_00625 [Nocardia sp. NBC_00565]|uniref:hypothetical protein n=1 Tax=Nocardia sp. NBC_00565 TaxID=2975993 RepID=UPI002E80E166|nr:hypothetical protein [Nocardia sp. NBC_00565]WUC03760.1 hypothetical protein OG874_00625 [Nocardia sp. NBC_00565]
MPDRLANVKNFYYSLALDGFGIRRHIGIDALPDDVKALHNRIVPALFDAIRADDPGYDPQGFHIDGKPGTAAKRTAAVRWFLELLEANKAFMEITGEKHGALYERLYQPGQHSCFLDDLTEALRKDDPNWRGPVE